VSARAARPPGAVIACDSISPSPSAGRRCAADYRRADLSGFRMKASFPVNLSDYSIHKPRYLGIRVKALSKSNRPSPSHAEQDDENDLSCSPPRLLLQRSGRADVSREADHARCPARRTIRTANERSCMPQVCLTKSQLAGSCHDVRPNADRPARASSALSYQEPQMEHLQLL
jgi:hypothetical protein